jgi:hypothetical protein
MDQIAVHFSSSEQVCESIAQLASANGVHTSKIQPAGSIAEALNAPITGAEIIVAAQVITAIFGAGAAAVEFLIKLRELLKDDQVVAVQPDSKKKPLLITRKTSDIDITRVLQ